MRLPRSVYRLLLAASAAASFAAMAAQPPGLQPLPEPPPPPPGVSDAELEPQVTITKRGEDKVEEYRIHNRLYMVKVTPPHGVPYYLVDEEGKGTWARRDTIGPNVQPPQWVIFSW